jgi:hypothetical protein
MLKILNNLRNVARPLITQSRNYPGMKHELYDHIQWVRPAKIASTEPVKSGDLAPLRFPDKNDLIIASRERQAEILKEINELTKKVLSVEMNPRHQSVNLAVEEMVRKVQRHDLDWGSMEAKCKFYWIINSLNLIVHFSGKNDGRNSRRSRCSRKDQKKFKDETKAQGVD